MKKNLKKKYLVALLGVIAVGALTATESTHAVARKLATKTARNNSSSSTSNNISTLNNTIDARKNDVRSDVQQVKGNNSLSKLSLDELNRIFNEEPQETTSQQPPSQIPPAGNKITNDNTSPSSSTQSTTDIKTDAPVKIEVNNKPKPPKPNNTEKKDKSADDKKKDTTKKPPKVNDTEKTNKKKNKSADDKKKDTTKKPPKVNDTEKTNKKKSKSADDKKKDTAKKPPKVNDTEKTNKKRSKSADDKKKDDVNKQPKKFNKEIMDRWKKKQEEKKEGKKEQTTNMSPLKMPSSLNKLNPSTSELANGKVNNNTDNNISDDAVAKTYMDSIKSVAAVLNNIAPSLQCTNITQLTQNNLPGVQNLYNKAYDAVHGASVISANSLFGTGAARVSPIDFEALPVDKVKLQKCKEEIDRLGASADLVSNNNKFLSVIGKDGYISQYSYILREIFQLIVDSVNSSMLSADKKNYITTQFAGQELKPYLDVINQDSFKWMQKYIPADCQTLNLFLKNSSQNQTLPNQTQMLPNQNQMLPNQNQTLLNQNQMFLNQYMTDYDRFIRGGTMPNELIQVFVNDRLDLVMTLLDVKKTFENMMSDFYEGDYLLLDLDSWFNDAEFRFIDSEGRWRSENSEIRDVNLEIENKRKYVTELKNKLKEIWIKADTKQKEMLEKLRKENKQNTIKPLTSWQTYETFINKCLGMQAVEGQPAIYPAAQFLRSFISFVLNGAKQKKNELNAVMTKTFEEVSAVQKKRIEVFSYFITRMADVVPEGFFPASSSIGSVTSGVSVPKLVRNNPKGYMEYYMRNAAHFENVRKNLAANFNQLNDMIKSAGSSVTSSDIYNSTISGDIGLFVKSRIKEAVVKLYKYFFAGTEVLPSFAGSVDDYKELIDRLFNESNQCYLNLERFKSTLSIVADSVKSFYAGSTFNEDTYRKNLAAYAKIVDNLNLVYTFANNLKRESDTYKAAISMFFMTMFRGKKFLKIQNADSDDTTPTEGGFAGLDSTGMFKKNNYATFIPELADKLFKQISPLISGYETSIDEGKDYVARYLEGIQPVLKEVDRPLAEMVAFCKIMKLDVRQLVKQYYYNEGDSRSFAANILGELEDVRVNESDKHSHVLLSKDALALLLEGLVNQPDFTLQTGVFANTKTLDKVIEKFMIASLKLLALLSVNTGSNQLNSAAVSFTDMFKAYFDSSYVQGVVGMNPSSALANGDLSSDGALGTWPLTLKIFASAFAGKPMATAGQAKNTLPAIVNKDGIAAAKADPVYLAGSNFYALFADSVYQRTYWKALNLLCNNIKLGADAGKVITPDFFFNFKDTTAVASTKPTNANQVFGRPDLTDFPDLEFKKAIVKDSTFYDGTTAASDHGTHRMVPARWADRVTTDHYMKNAEEFYETYASLMFDPSISVPLEAANYKADYEYLPYAPVGGDPKQRRTLFTVLERSEVSLPAILLYLSRQFGDYILANANKVSAFDTKANDKVEILKSNGRKTNYDAEVYWSKLVGGDDGKILDIVKEKFMPPKIQTSPDTPTSSTPTSSTPTSGTPISGTPVSYPPVSYPPASYPPASYPPASYPPMGYNPSTPGFNNSTLNNYMRTGAPSVPSAPGSFRFPSFRWGSRPR